MDKCVFLLKSICMKQVIGIALLFSLCLPYFGTFLWLHYQIHETRSEVREHLEKSLENNELVLLKISDRKLLTKLQHEGRNEFHFGGKLFDIAKVKMQNDTLFAWCWQDDEENELNSRIDQLLTGLSSENPAEEEGDESLITLFDCDLFYSDDHTQKICIGQRLSSHYPYQSVYQSRAQIPIAPPPQLG